MKKTYKQPLADITVLSMEAFICESGSGEDLGITEPVNPWGVPMDSSSDVSFLF